MDRLIEASSLSRLSIWWLGAGNCVRGGNCRDSCGNRASPISGTRLQFSLKIPSEVYTFLTLCDVVPSDKFIGPSSMRLTLHLNDNIIREHGCLSFAAVVRRDGRFFPRVYDYQSPASRR